QLYTSYCALKEVQRLVHELKANNAWDNTSLIFVSDHGFKGDIRLAEAFSQNGEINFNNYPGRPEALLLVKDFDENGALQTSTQLMSPADVPSIICSEIGGCDAIAEDPRNLNNPYRKLIYTTGPAHPDRHEKNRYKIDETWEVTGDMYQRENWKRVESE
ncbi:MAG TPA: sulfatase-like hydrolase/transferase, partial [Candidatus Ignatzschineria merdigallinarum]|nr:sulfatase-like hydrolase/transferase [Candidatus Ignatzschineria merdigallinarum]